MIGGRQYTDHAGGFDLGRSRSKRKRGYGRKPGGQMAGLYLSAACVTGYCGTDRKHHSGWVNPKPCIRQLIVQNIGENEHDF